MFCTVGRIIWVNRNCSTGCKYIISKVNGNNNFPYIIFYVYFHVLFGQLVWTCVIGITIKSLCRREVKWCKDPNYSIRVCSIQRVLPSQIAPIGLCDPETFQKETAKFQIRLFCDATWYWAIKSWCRTTEQIVRCDNVELICFGVAKSGMKSDLSLLVSFQPNVETE